MPAVDRNLLNNLRVARHFLAEIVRVEQIEHALLSATQEQIRPGQECETGSAQVIVVRAQSDFVAGCEVIEQRQPGSGDLKLHQRITEIPSPITLPIAGREVSIAGRIDCRSSPSLPAAA